MPHGAMRDKKGMNGKSKGTKISGGLKGSKSTKQTGSMKAGNSSRRRGY